MADARTIKVAFIGEASKLKTTMADVDAKTKSLGKSMSGLGEKMSTGLKIAGVGAITAVGGALFEGVKDALSYQKVTAQTAAVLKSTGDASGLTAQQVADLGDQIEGYSTFSNDAVQSGENMLLTFTNIQNKAGAGNDIFTQSTKVLADMSTALGVDMPTAALQLGKALNDPVTGMAALRREGVSFTTAQQTQIKAMVASGDTMGAQKLMLGELSKEFGGSAKAAGDTFAGSMTRLKNEFSDVMRDLMTKLMPALQKFGEWLTSKGLPFLQQVIAKMQEFGGWIQKNREWLEPLVIVLGGAAAAVLVVVEAVKVWTAVQTAFNLVMDANPLVLVIAAIGALVAGVIYAYTHFQTFRDVVQTVFRDVKGAISAVINWLKSNWPLVLGILTGPFGLAVEQIITHWGTIMSFFKGIPGKIKTIFGDVWHGVANGLKDALDAVLHLPLKIPSVHVGPVHFGGMTLIPALASGTTNFGGGLALVGEQGPELVTLPHGAGVTPAGQTAAMLGGGRMHPDDIAALAHALGSVLNGAAVKARLRADTTPGMGVFSHA